MLATINTIELLELWDELRDAEAGTNRYGGTVAELYAYRFGTADPSFDRSIYNEKNPFHVETANSKARALYALLNLYAEKRKVTIKINNKKLGVWLLKEAFYHRVHVEVIAKGTR